ncbi:hypothetical protein [Variovorax sp. Root411]|uniref:hypothetical protein n=1 Tax=Variovorax sp. Root411 TaxID=1736530 RepID=UPI0006F95425|nr:hypothetical protein [Variovorax sp. Root411]KQW54335.1 hypothetical protein ASC92_20085 [Variovorax sp. Root411]
MSIEFLRKLSKLRSPLDLTRPDDIDNLLVLRAAGMVAAFTLRNNGHGDGVEVGRFLSLTPEGRRALAPGDDDGAALPPQ